MNKKDLEDEKTVVDENTGKETTVKVCPIPLARINYEDKNGVKQRIVGVLLNDDEQQEKMLEAIKATRLIREGDVEDLSTMDIDTVDSPNLSVDLDDSTMDSSNLSVDLDDSEENNDDDDLSQPMTSVSSKNGKKRPSGGGIVPSVAAKKLKVEVQEEEEGPLKIVKKNMPLKRKELEMEGPVEGGEDCPICLDSSDEDEDDGAQRKPPAPSSSSALAAPASENEVTPLSALGAVSAVSAEAFMKATFPVMLNRYTCPATYKYKASTDKLMAMGFEFQQANKAVIKYKGGYQKALCKLLRESPAAK